MEFIIYANALRNRVNAFLDQTNLKLPPAKSNKFFYEHHSPIENASSNSVHFDAKYKAPKSEDVLKIIHAIQNQLIEKPISSLEAFKRIVSNWTAIPPDFVGACWNAEMTSRDGLVQWIFERLKLFSLDSETEELVDWIIGLLSHPDFSRPDALAAELEEFLLTHTADFILSLWKYIITEVAKQYVFHPKTSTKAKVRIVNNLDQRARQKEQSSEKQARRIHRGKSGRLEPVAGFRDIIASQMSAIHHSGGWHVAQAPQPVPDDRDEETDRSMTAHWRQLGSLLDARDYSMRQQEEKKAHPSRRRSCSRHIRRSRHKQRSRRSRSRSRSRSRRPGRYKR